MENRSDCYIRSVMPLKDYRLFMEMESGSTVTVDLSGKLLTVKYGLLKDEALFFDVTTDGDYVSWGNGRVRVSVKELMDVVLLGEI
jgi:hypothetical protein